MFEDTCTRFGVCIDQRHDHSDDDVPALSELVDTTEPAFSEIAKVLTEMMSANVDFTPDVVAAAVKVGRHKHQRQQPEPKLAPSTRRADKTAGPVVYYIRRGHLIKIGTTTNMHDRMHALMPDEILAIEPGDRAVEKARHKEFAGLRTSRLGEYFYPGPILQAHIARLRRLHGQPDPKLPSLKRPPRTRSAGNAIAGQ